MPDSLRPVALSVSVFEAMEAIVVRFVAPDGREIVLLVSRDAVAGLRTHLSSLG
ncbi:hypothetical protein [uncultured Methylobacterium sp.]|uniref:hypothetical protein n=1 Tax=uncultured Methylobacterium sp. TaxID=157278 RepID=UPI0035CB8AEE